MNNWTEKHIKGLLFDKKIRGYQANKKVLLEGSAKIPQPKSKALIWLEWNLQFYSNEKALTLETEFRFCPERKFRSDFAIPAHKILIEYEGGIFTPNSGHNSHSGIQRDIDKYQLAQKLGYRVIRLTALNYTTVLKTLNEMIG